MLYHPCRHWTPSLRLALAVNMRGCARYPLCRARAPDTRHLVLAGSPGSGKTHLLHALAHARRNFCIDSIACLSATQWAQEVAAGWVCRHRLRIAALASHDLLALDDADRLWVCPSTAGLCRACCVSAKNKVCAPY